MLDSVRMQSIVEGWGHYLPPEVEQLGVRRPIEIEPVGASTLAARALPRALTQAQCAVENLDFLIFATWTPDVTFPGAGCYLQPQIDAGTIGALDIRAQCAGFLFGLAIADQFVRTATYRRVLVAAAEVHSAGLDYSERGAAVARLFGDGAGVAIVGPASSGGLRSVVTHTDGRRHREFWCEYPASRMHPVRITTAEFRQGKHFPSLDEESVRSFGLEALPRVIGEALQKASLKPTDVDHFILAHVLPDVAEGTARALGLAAERWSAPAMLYGHLAAAALPVAVSTAIEAGKLGKGATVCLAACGAGFAWGAAVLTL